MQEEKASLPPYFSRIKPLWDRVLTISIWTYFTLGFVLFFSPFYLLSWFFSKNREPSFQKLNHLFYKYMFVLLRTLTPGLSIHISHEVLSVRSSVIICNHLSYLDSILLVSLYEKQKTIVKSRFFNFPIFGRVLNISGYIPSATGGPFDQMMIERIEGMADYLATGGNLFVFPEGTRSRNGKMGKLNKGVFKIARRCKAPIKILRIRNSDQLFRPGKFLFNTCVPIRMILELVDEIHPDYEAKDFSVSALTEQVKKQMEGAETL